MGIEVLTNCYESFGSIGWRKTALMIIGLSSVASGIYRDGLDVALTRV